MAQFQLPAVRVVNSADRALHFVTDGKYGRPAKLESACRGVESVPPGGFDAGQIRDGPHGRKRSMLRRGAKCTACINTFRWDGDKSDSSARRNAGNQEAERR